MSRVLFTVLILILSHAILHNSIVIMDTHSACCIIILPLLILCIIIWTWSKQRQTQNVIGDQESEIDTTLPTIVVRHSQLFIILEDLKVILTSK
jgi:protein-S-isoprenylcysteine O-methyltransferase Ste14